jgi:hypothetical protein
MGEDGMKETSAPSADTEVARGETRRGLRIQGVVGTRPKSTNSERKASNQIRNLEGDGWVVI